MERIATVVKRKQSASSDLAYWRSRPMAERVAAAEVQRQQAFAQQPESDA